MSTFVPGGCGSPSYGSYSVCSNCGPTQAPDPWDPLDAPVVSSPSGGGSCRQTSPPLFTPPGRCDFQERASRNRYDRDQAFDYGSVYLGPVNPTDVSYPWGIPMGGLANGYYVGDDPSYGEYVGSLDRSRRLSSVAPPRANRCGYDRALNPKTNMTCMASGTGVVTKDSQQCLGGCRRS